MEAQANERRYAFLCGSCNKTHFAPYGLVLQNCPACGSTDLRFEGKRASAQEIDGVIPFFITTEELPKLIRGYLGNALVRPALFKHSMQVTKRFVPFWVFDEKASGVLMLKGADFDYDVRHNYETDYTAYCQRGIEGHTRGGFYPHSACDALDKVGLRMARFRRGL